MLSRVADIKLVLLSIFCVLLLHSYANADEALVKSIQLVKPSVVAIGTVQKTRNPQYVFQGTGFVVGNGKQIITNNHVVPSKLDHTNREYMAIFYGEGRQFQAIPADLVKKDATHDLALLEIAKQLPALEVADSKQLPAGSDIAFTGFPIGMVLGLYPVTHQGIIAGNVPLAIPPASQKKLTTSMIRALRNPFTVYQLDAVAYPGNSGSPVFDPKTGKVVAVINSVYVKGKKETALSDPTGISYAIPAKHVNALLGR